MNGKPGTTVATAATMTDVKPRLEPAHRPEHSKAHGAERTSEKGNRGPDEVMNFWNKPYRKQARPASDASTTTLEPFTGISQ